MPSTASANAAMGAHLE
jgi:hypothetical protein